MIEIGRLGFPYRSAAITTGAASQAEAEGVDAIWFVDRLETPIAGAPQLDGLLGEIVPDASAFADPVVAAATTLMVTRRVTVGAILDVTRRDALAVAQTAATLAELAPGRFVLGLRHAPDASSRLDACLAAVGDLTSGSGFGVIVVGGAEAREVAARRSAGWLAEQQPSVDTFAELLGGSGGHVDALAAGVMLDVIVHDDPAVAERAATQPALCERDLFAGTPAELVASLKPYVDAGAQRFVLDNVLPVAAPEELAASDRALHTAIRNARLTFRGVA